jgi:phi13 family phage major tail protein
MPVIKNIRKLYVSKITSETAGVPTYGTMRYIHGLREITVTPGVEQGEFYAEGSLAETESTLSKVDVSINVSDVAPADYIFLTGAKEAVEGGFIDNANDESPYLALHYEKVLSGGIIEYATLFKGKLRKPEDSAATSEGSPNYQPKTLAGTFMTIGNGDWRHVVRDNDPKFATYTLTSDADINSSKTYYTRTGSAGAYVYSAVAEPIVGNIATYYEKTLVAPFGDSKQFVLPTKA